MPETVDQVKLAVFKGAARLAQSPTVAKLDEDEPTAAACMDLWPSIYESALARYEWPWALERIEIQPSATPPLGDDWRARHPLPDDFLRLRKIVTRGAGPSQRLGSWLLTNFDSAMVVEYVRRVEETKSSHVFRRVAQELLAIDLAVTVKQDQKLADRLERRMYISQQMAAAECTDWAGKPPQMTLQPPSGFGDAADRRPDYLSERFTR